MEETKWFWVWLILATVRKAESNLPNARCEIWKNLILVSAPDEESAYSKAIAFGRREEGDSSGSLTLNGEPAVAKLLGINDMGLIHEGLVDGAEVLWQMKKTTAKRAASLVKAKADLMRNVREELKYSG